MNESLYAHEPERYPSLRDGAVQNLHEPPSDSLLTLDEQTVLNSLAEAYNQFVALPVLHPWERQEFMHAIHLAQQIVMSRPVLRDLQQ